MKWKDVQGLLYLNITIMRFIIYFAYILVMPYAYIYICNVKTNPEYSQAVNIEKKRENTNPGGYWMKVRCHPCSFKMSPTFKMSTSIPLKATMDVSGSPITSIPGTLFILGSCIKMTVLDNILLNDYIGLV